MLKPWQPLRPAEEHEITVTADLAVGNHRVELLTTIGDSAFPVVVRDTVTGEILRFTRNGVSAPDGNGKRLCVGVPAGIGDLPFLWARTAYEDAFSSVSNALQVEMTDFQVGSDEAKLIWRFVEIVNSLRYNRLSALANQDGCARGRGTVDPEASGNTGSDVHISAEGF